MKNQIYQWGGLESQETDSHRCNRLGLGMGQVVCKAGCGQSRPLCIIFLALVPSLLSLVMGVPGLSPLRCPYWEGEAGTGNLESTCVLCSQPNPLPVLQQAAEPVLRAPAVTQALASADPWPLTGRGQEHTVSSLA